MREILFRGKRIDNGEWVEVDFIAPYFISPYQNSELYINETFVNGKSVDGIVWCQGSFYRIDPSTVGQYTGLKDKNGRKIWEGDIIKIDNGERSCISVVKFGEYCPKLFYDMLDICFPHRLHLNANGFFAESNKHEDMILFKSPFIEVIGNIHDNKLEDFDNGR